jgi:hypothetical protein
MRKLRRGRLAIGPQDTILPHKGNPAFGTHTLDGGISIEEALVYGILSGNLGRCPLRCAVRYLCRFCAWWLHKNETPLAPAISVAVARPKRELYP